MFQTEGRATLKAAKLPGTMKLRRQRVKRSPEALLIKVEKAEENLPETVQGKGVGSKEEARVAVALPMLGLGFRYQVPIAGGRNFPGGLVLDFLVETTPLPTPMAVQSSYWHGTRKPRGQDLLMLAKIKRVMGHAWADPVEIWDDQLQSVADALTNIPTVLRMGGAS